MAVYISDGVSVNASWVNSIAISSDGSNWSTINKETINVIARWVNLPSTTGVNKIPFVNKGTHAEISLTAGSDDTPIATFDPNDVTNQVTWNGNTQAALDTAVSDITGWL